MADTTAADQSTTTAADTTATKPAVVTSTVTPSATSHVQAKADAAPSITSEQVAELVTKGIAEAQAKWEAERLPKLRAEVAEAVTAPIRRDAKIKSLREELRSAGKHKPADDDATDLTSPGDIAALADLDDIAIVAKDKAGNGLTRLDVEIKRTRERLGKRKAEKTGDSLETPPIEPGDDKFYENIRTSKQADEAALAKSRSDSLARVWNTGR